MNNKSNRRECPKCGKRAVYKLITNGMVKFKCMACKHVVQGGNNGNESNAGENKSGT